MRQYVNNSKDFAVAVRLANKNDEIFFDERDIVIIKPKDPHHDK